MGTNSTNGCKRGQIGQIRHPHKIQRVGSSFVCEIDRGGFSLQSRGGRLNRFRIGTKLAHYGDHLPFDMSMSFESLVCGDVHGADFI